MARFAPARIVRGGPGVDARRRLGPTCGVTLPTARIERATALSRLGAFARQAAPAAAAPRQAGVAVVLVGDAPDVATHVLLTRRASHLARHAGQFALPGGRLDPGEDATAAALRELREEVSLRRDPGDVLGALDDVVTRSGFRITPVVVWAAGPIGPPTPDPAEVAAVYRVPLAELDREDARRLDRLAELERPVLSLDLPTTGTRVFAPTAAVLFQLREVLLRGRATRVAGYEQPPFAWR